MGTNINLKSSVSSLPREKNMSFSYFIQAALIEKKKMTDERLKIFIVAALPKKCPRAKIYVI